MTITGPAPLLGRPSPGADGGTVGAAGELVAALALVDGAAELLGAGDVVRLGPDDRDDSPQAVIDVVSAMAVTRRTIRLEPIIGTVGS